MGNQPKGLTDLKAKLNSQREKKGRYKKKESIRREECFTASEDSFTLINKEESTKQNRSYDELSLPENPFQPRPRADLNTSHQHESLALKPLIQKNSKSNINQDNSDSHFFHKNVEECSYLQDEENTFLTTRQISPAHIYPKFLPNSIPEVVCIHQSDRNKLRAPVRIQGEQISRRSSRSCREKQTHRKEEVEDLRSDSFCRVRKQCFSKTQAHKSNTNRSRMSADQKIKSIGERKVSKASRKFSRPSNSAAIKNAVRLAEKNYKKGNNTSPTLLYDANIAQNNFDKYVQTSAPSFREKKMSFQQAIDQISFGPDKVLIWKLVIKNPTDNASSTMVNQP